MNFLMRVILTILSIAIVAFAFANCGSSEMFTTHRGGRVTGQKICADDLKATFSRTYYPFLRSNCSSCHQHENSHASADFTTAFSAFMSKGTEVIDTRATNPHGDNGLDSPTMRSQINAFKSDWINGETRYENCIAGESFDPTKAMTLRLADRFMDNIESTRTANDVWTKMSWDLSTEPVLTSAQGLLKGSFTIEVRYLMNNGVVEGLLFRNPTISLLAGQDSVKLSGIGVRLNGNSNPYFSTYRTLDQTVPVGPSTLALAPNSNPAMAPDSSASSVMRVGIELLQFQGVK